jgi:hypothetical protein
VLLGKNEVADMTPRETWAVVGTRAARARREAKARAVIKGLPETRSGIKVYGSLYWALVALALEGQLPEDALQERIGGLSYEMDSVA